MKENAPLIEPITNGFTKGWARWFTQVWIGLLGWTQSYTTTETIDFGLVAANSESAGTAVTVTGVRLPTATIPLACVEVTPSSNTAGITYKALVTARDQVTVYAINYTAAGINPASLTFRIIVKQ
jgi:hypothetical protein